MALIDKLTAIADAIRGKTGKADALTLDQMATEISGIETGPVLTDLEVTENGEYTPPDGVDGFGKVTANVAGSGLPEWFANILQFNGMFSPLSWYINVEMETVDLDIRTLFPQCRSLQSCFTGVHGISSITVHADTVTNINNMFFNHNTFNDSALKVIDLTDFRTDIITTWTSAFSGRRGLHTIRGVLDFTGATSWSQVFRYCASLENVVFAANTISLTTDQYTFADCNALSDATIVSLANGLKADTKTLDLPDTPKARCDEIIGTVSQKTAEDGTTYDFFTVDSAGTVTLTEFITVTKGWTLA